MFHFFCLPIFLLYKRNFEITIFCFFQHTNKLLKKEREDRAQRDEEIDQLKEKNRDLKDVILCFYKFIFCYFHSSNIKP